MLICVSTKDNYYISCSITVGKTYKFCTKYDGEEQWKDESKKCVYIVDDYGYSKEYPKTCFKTLVDFREQRINTILDEE